jgi:hypothetical protein
VGKWESGNITTKIKMTRWTRFTRLRFCLIDSGGMRQCLAKVELTVHGQVHISHAKAQSRQEIISDRIYRINKIDIYHRERRGHGEWIGDGASLLGGIRLGLFSKRKDVSATGSTLLPRLTIVNLGRSNF